MPHSYICGANDGTILIRQYFWTHASSQMLWFLHHAKYPSIIWIHTPCSYIGVIFMIPQRSHKYTNGRYLGWDEKKISAPLLDGLITDSSQKVQMPTLLFHAVYSTYDVQRIPAVLIAKHLLFLIACEFYSIIYISVLLLIWITDMCWHIYLYYNKTDIVEVKRSARPTLRPSTLPALISVCLYVPQYWS